MEINEQVKEIKQSFRQMMDGAIAKSMRDKGLEYRLNWGATLPRLREMAHDIRMQTAAEGLSAYHLAIALWKEEVRECKILATMLMPPGELPIEVAEIWMEQTHSQEIAEQLAFNLLQQVPYAPLISYRWMASDKELYQLCAFHIMSRLFMNGQEPSERGINEFLDQAIAALQGPFPSVRKAAMQSVLHFAELGLVYERMAKSVLKSINLELF